MMEEKRTYLRGFSADKQGDKEITLPDGTKVKGSWVNGTLTNSICKSCWTIGVKETELVPCTIAPWIHRTDKNGRMVYDGDIIRWEFKLEDDEEIMSVEIIEWDDEVCGFLTRVLNVKNEASIKSDIPGQEDFSSEIEVIGNRWENPELFLGGC